MNRRTLLFASKPLGLRCAETIHHLAPETLAGIVTLDDSADSRSALSNFREWTSAKNIPLHVVRDRDEAEGLLSVYEPDLVLCISWYWFIRKSALTKPPLGFIGIHFSLLPRYRGGSPLVWAILSGERQTGVSFFTLMERMDEGPLWAQRPLRIPAEAYVDTVLASAERLTVEMLGDVYPGILSGQIRPRPQVGEANVVPMRRPEDGLIDWSQPARRVFDFVRAQSRPYPGAFTSDGVRIWRASIGPWISGPPGTVVDAAGRAGIVCGDGIALIVEESEPPVA